MSEKMWMPSLGKPKSFVGRGLDRLQQFKKRVKDNVFGQYPDKDHFPPEVPDFPSPKPPAPTTFCAPFPDPAPPQGWWTPGQHDHEASGSNHTSLQNSEYFDALDLPEYLLQHQIPNFSDFYGRLNTQELGIEDPLADSFDEMLLSTPTSRDPNPCAQPFISESVNHHVPAGELEQSWLLGSVDGAATSVHGLRSMSVMTGDTVESKDFMVDTGDSTSPYILPPVAEERSKKKAFYNFYCDFRRILRGEDDAGGSGRRGRGVRVLARIVCIAVRLKGRRLVNKILKKARKRRVGCEPERRKYCKKKMRAGESTEPGPERSALYKGIKKRNGKWHAEIRVSKIAKAKVWVGTFASEKEAALAYDAGLFHCNYKDKEFNFPELVAHLGPSQYNYVSALFKDGCKHEATVKVKEWASAHAAAYGSQQLPRPEVAHSH